MLDVGLIMEVAEQYQPFLNGVYDPPKGKLFYKARPNCWKCSGEGETDGGDCDCVRLNVFRDLWKHWHECEGRSRLACEFRADFQIVARHNLSPARYRVFKRLLHGEVVGAGEYRDIGVRVGQACIETRPYPLFPLHDYYTKTHTEAMDGSPCRVGRTRIRPVTGPGPDR